MNGILLAVGITLFLLVIVLLIWRYTFQPKVLPTEVFARIFKTFVETRYPGSEVTLNDDFSAEVYLNENSQIVSLYNCYTTYKRQPRRLEETIAYYIDQLLQSTKAEDVSSWEEAKSHIMPAIKPKDFFNQPIGSKEADLIDGLVRFKFNEDLVIILMLDTEKVMQMLSLEKLRSWGIGESEALRYAINNLTAKTTEPLWNEAVKNAKSRGVVIFGTADAYDAARFLIPEFYQRVSTALGCSTIMVAIPNRDILIATNADNAQLVERLRVQAEQDFAQYPYPISPQPIFLNSSAVPKGIS